jgi:hypothetical protein
MKRSVSAHSDAARNTAHSILCIVYRIWTHLREVERGATAWLMFPRNDAENAGLVL